MKPPVVVIERHCKTNQCWIAVRFKKIKSVAKISQSAAEERADDALAKRVPLAASQKNIFVMRARAILGSFYSRLRRRFTRATGEGSSTPQKAPRRASRPPTVERCLLPVTPDESGAPIIM